MRADEDWLRELRYKIEDDILAELDDDQEADNTAPTNS